MLKLTIVLSTLVLGLSGTFTHAAGTGSGKGVGPCAQIEKDCRTAGYVTGEANQGKGFWWDCMCPLIGENFAEPSKNVLSVPSDQSLVASCRQHPNGQKIQAKCAHMLAEKNAKQGRK